MAPDAAQSRSLRSPIPGAAAVISEALEPRRLLAAGQLDPTFAGDGTLRADFRGDDAALAVALQPTGNGLVTAGASDGDALLAWFDAAGAADLNFGGGDGWAVDDWGTTADQATAVIPQAGGHVLVAGRTRDRVVLARYRPDGTADASFGTDGAGTTFFTPRADLPNASVHLLKVTGDGSILLAGRTGAAGSGAAPTHVFASRFDSSGRPDPSFGSGGSAVAAFPGGVTALPRGMALQPDGALVVVGQRNAEAAAPAGVVVTRYLPGLVPDPRFDGDGWRALNAYDIEYGGTTSPLDVAIGVDVAPDGKIVVAGGSFQRTLALRFTPTGALDPTFGGNGVVFTQLGQVNSAAVRALVGPEGGVYLGASPFYTPPGSAYGSADMAVARLRPNGTLDTTYGTGGRTYADYSDRTLPADAGLRHESIFGMLLDASGALVLAGDTGPQNVQIGNPERGDAAVVRLQPVDVPPVVTSARYAYEAERPTVSLRFSEWVTGFTAADVTLVNLTSGGPSPAPPVLVAMNAAGDGADVIFYPVGTPRQSLPNGNYRLTVRAAAFNDSTGNPLASAYVFEFFVLAGDINRDRRVDSSDFATLAGNFGKRDTRYDQGDLNADGTVDSSDFAILAGNFGKSVPAPQAAAPVSAAQEVFAAAPPAPVRRSQRLPRGMRRVR